LKPLPAPRVWHSPRYELELPGCRFDTSKFRRVVESLLALRVIDRGQLAEPSPASVEILSLVHEDSWVRKVVDDKLGTKDFKLLEFPSVPGLALAHRLCAQGTLEACRDALSGGIGLHAGGGSHHAFADHGEGFCVFNDLAVGVTAALADGARRAAVVDLDAHQGNGTASIFEDDPRVFTFSMHRKEGYPENRSASALDVELRDGIGDAEYLGILREKLPAALDASMPDLVVYQAGVDVYERDALGGLGLSARGIAERDRFVLSECRDRRLPVAVTLGGGYALEPSETVELHAATLRIAVECFAHVI
jgi:acetoin utilization deacetylase AcuC-like enzyme